MKYSTISQVHRICPLVHNPARHCHCVGMNSDKIREVVRYCMGRYTQCDIYLKLSKKFFKKVSKIKS